jgi:hypothetical protein
MPTVWNLTKWGKKDLNTPFPVFRDPSRIPRLSMEIYVGRLIPNKAVHNPFDKSGIVNLIGAPKCA